MSFAHVVGVLRGYTVIPVTWNPLDKHSTISLSNNNLTYAKVPNAAWVSCRATKSYSAGKRYFEVTMNAGGPGTAGVAGIGKSNAVLSNYCGKDANGIGLSASGNRVTSDVSTATLAALAQGDTVCFAVDLDNNKIWFRKNNLAWNSVLGGVQDPATNTGGVAIPAGVIGAVFPMGSVFDDAPQEKGTGRFGSGAFLFTPPSGFSAWES